MADLKMFIDDETELKQLLTEWKERLALSDWCIYARFCTPDEFSDTNNAGQCSTDWVNKNAVILLRRPDCTPSGQIQRQAQEAVLIHELLHCKFMSFENNHALIEDAAFEVTQHGLLEDMAKALYCAKYSLKRSFFTDVMLE